MSKYYDKTAASFKSVTIDTKVLDAQKILINSNPNDVNQRENLLDVLNEIDVTPSYTSYQYIDYCEKSSNTGDCSAVKLHANLLPHGKNIKAIRLDVANTVDTETWLVAYLVDANNNFTSIGKSINSNIWSSGDLVEWEFEKAFQIPEGSYLQLYIADANSTISATNVTRPSYKIKLYIADHSGDNQDSVRYDGTWYNQRRVYVQFKEELKLELSQYLDYKLNEVESNLDLVQEQVNTNAESIDSIGQDVETNSENIEALRLDVNSLFTYQDAVRDVNTMQGTLDNATIYGILYSKEHFGIYGTQISKVTLPYNTQSGQSNTGYLVAQVFDNANQLIASYYSEGTHTFSNAGPAVFNFKDAYIAVNYKFIRFVLVANKTVALPTAYNSINSSCLSFRVRPIKWSDSFTFDDDDCLVYSNQSTGTLNWLIEMTIDYKLRVENNNNNNMEIYDYIVESYYNGTEWYRLYKSGWVEQGGITATGSNGVTERTVTLPVELKTSNYFVQLTQTGYYNSTYAYQVKDLTTTSFKVYTHTGGVQLTAAMWEAKGLRPITNDITRANGYIPDASSWNSSVLTPNNLTITRVENEVGYNGNTKSITMYTSLIENGSNLMKGNTNLTSWNSDLSRLTNGSSMFRNCTNLTTVSFGENGLGSLNEAADMFYGCSLNYQSLNNILNALPTGSGTIHITVADSVESDLANDENFEDGGVPAYSSGKYYEFTHSSGWTIQLTSQSGFSTLSYDVSEANGYTPDASKWNEEIYIPYTPNIVSVVNGVAYDGLV